MVGLAFGINCEMYFPSGSNAQNYFHKCQEINLYKPVDLTFHIPFSRTSALYILEALAWIIFATTNFPVLLVQMSMAEMLLTDCRMNMA